MATKTTTEQVKDVYTIPEKEETVTIKLPLTRDKQADVPVIINGRSWLLKRGVEVEVPKCVYEVLQNSEKMDSLAVERSMSLIN